MKRLGKYTAAVCTIILFLHGTTSVRAQTRPALSLGDPVPGLAYSKWIKGEPYIPFRDQKIYVLEFWATWCTPCIAAMPHLSELAQAYKDKVAVIGVNILERTGNKPYDSSLPAVTAFVKKNSERMQYSVIADNNDKVMTNQWFTASGQSGIPATIVVREGKVQWIGHPMFVDTVLKAMVNGQYDLASNKKRYEEQFKVQQTANNGFQQVIGRIDSAIAVKDFDKAIKLSEQDMRTMPKYAHFFVGKKLGVVIKNYPAAEALRIARETLTNEPKMGEVIAMSIIPEDGLSKEMYDFAAAILAERPGTTFSLDNLAIARSKAGDYKAAVAAKAKVIDLLKEAMKDPKYKDIITPERLSSHEKQLKEYEGFARRNHQL